MPEIFLGTSGYDYPEWKGVFYPADLKRKDFLCYYATKFNALELNNTFYNMPTADRLLSFYERSEGKLEFSIKANRLLTHEITGLVFCDMPPAASSPDFQERFSGIFRPLDNLFSYIFYLPPVIFTAD
ncbi:DUF72 domain-containing protein [Treponema sp.]|uniref:DUF72 domain-containing protein n=1 Tax=Treponema sp. TaxID=166 RepID=UPI00388DD77B